MKIKKIIGLIGFPLKHSFSAKYFTEKFSLECIDDYEYRNFELKSIDVFNNLIFSYPNLIAVNVTMPYKEQIIKFLDNISFDANIIQAVNLVTIDRTSQIPKLTGYNTDIYGIEFTLKELIKENSKALILGTGGASKSVKYTLDKMNISNNLVSRTKQNNVKYTYSNLSENIINNHKLIINTTPLGMFPLQTEYPKIPYQFIGNDHILFDLIYNPANTIFLKNGAKYGAKTINGYKMLKKQADKAWEIIKNTR